MRAFVVVFCLLCFWVSTLSIAKADLASCEASCSTLVPAHCSEEACGCSMQTVNSVNGCHATPCADLTDGCYNHNDRCHQTDSSGSQCLDGAPTSCEGYWTDPHCANGGLALLGCDQSNLSGFCKTMPLACGDWNGATCEQHDGCLFQLSHCQSCSHDFSGNPRSESNCYSHESRCHYDAINGCIAGAPSGFHYCKDLYRDLTNCPSSNPSGGGCYHDSDSICHLSCIGLSETLCASQPNCHWDGDSETGACAIGPPFLGCAASSTQTSCSGSGCYWDMFLNQCFVSLSAALYQYPCSTWSSPTFTVQSLACPAHGCQQVGNLCFDAGDGFQQPRNDTTFIYAIQAAFLSPRILPNTLTFEVHLRIPLRLRSDTPFWGVVSIGMPWHSIPNPDNPNDPTVTVTPDPFCNSVVNMPVHPPYATSELDSTWWYQDNSPTSLAQLQTYLINWVNTTNSLTFNTSTPEGRILTNLYGSWNIGPGLVVTNITIPSASNTMDFLISGDLETWARRCSGASQIDTDTMTSWEILVTYSERSWTDGVTQASVDYLITSTAKGSVSISPNSRYPAVLKKVDTVVDTGSCDPGNFSIDFTMVLEYQSIFDTSLWIGPRSIADIIMQDPATLNEPFTPSNCYGLTPVSFVRQPLFNNTQRITLGFTTRCRDQLPNPTTFSQCSNAKPSDKALDNGLTNGVPNEYPTRLDSSFNFWANVYSCPTGVTTTPACILINQKADGTPDAYVHTEDVSSKYADQSLPNIEHQVMVGLLDAESSPLNALHDIATWGQLNRSAILDSHQEMILLIRLNNDSLANFNLTIIPNSIVVTALNTDGTFSNSVIKNLTWSQLNLTIASALPKMAAVGIQVARVQACKDVAGCDALGLQVPRLHTALPAIGYQIAFDYQIRSKSTTALGSRRLLSTTISIDSTYSTTFSIFIQPNGTTVTIDLPGPMTYFEKDFGHGPSDALGMLFGLFLTQLFLLCTFGQFIQKCLFNGVIKRRQEHNADLRETTKGPLSITGS